MNKLNIIFAAFLVLLILSFGGSGGEKHKLIEGFIDDLSVSLSGNVPTDVPFGVLTENDINNRPHFDEFSWKMFIALSWPVETGNRGVPLTPNDASAFLNMNNTTPIVWTSYKNQWDLFDQGDNQPSAWDVWDNPINKCKTSGTNHILNSSKNVTVVGETNESFSVPLVDQNKNYILFELRYNKPQYEFIANNGLYNSTKLMKYQMNHDGFLTMPSSTADTEGSILVKAAWKELTPGDANNNRYYIINEEIYDPISNLCIEKTLGLVGLHIAQKTKNFPQWIWSSFEQVDNVPGDIGAQKPYTFNDGIGTDKAETSVHGFANKPSSKLIEDTSKRTPVQVTRLNKVPTTPTGKSTVDINKKYQKTVKGTWMEYYQLVITQWPSDPDNFKEYTENGIYPGNAGGAFPINNCVNTTMETYFQNQNDAAGAGGNSCMSCHYKAANVDFSWSVFLRSHN